MNQSTDDGLDWLRKIRADIAKECDYNPYKLGEYYRSLQAPYKNRMIGEEDKLIRKQAINERAST